MSRKMENKSDFNKIVKEYGLFRMFETRNKEYMLT